MSVIAYDRPVRDFIAALDATGHVSPGAYRKTSVTMHHNGGRLSLQGCLDVWKIREASAHFDVDSAGNVGQYVRVNGYAWAVGNTCGNSSTISIEMANSANSPSWAVAAPTWQNGARLAGWLFARVIGARPSSGNYFVHSHWYNTDCAGPYIHSMWSPIMAAAQTAYDTFTGAKPTKPLTYTVDNVKAIQRDVRVTPDGIWGRDTDPVCNHVAAAAQGQPFSVSMVQHATGARVDGLWGPASKAALVVTVRAIQHDALGVPADGRWGPATDAAYHRLRTKFWH